MKYLLVLLGAWFVLHAGREAADILDELESIEHDTEQ